MITFPRINPIAFSLGPLHIRWYGLMYLLGFLAAWALARWRTARYHLAWTADQISDLIFLVSHGCYSWWAFGVYVVL